MNTNNANAIHGENFEKKSANSVPAKYPISGMPPWNTPKSTAISTALGEKRAQCCSPGRTTQLVASPFETETAKQSIAKPIAISMIERISTEECTNYDLRMNTKTTKTTSLEVSSFCFVACSSFALGDIAEFILAELAADGRDTVGEDMCLKMVVLMKHNTRGKVR